MWSSGFEAGSNGGGGYYAHSSHSQHSSFEPSYPSSSYSSYAAYSEEGEGGAASHAYGTSYSSMRRRRQGPVSRLGAAVGERVQDEWRKSKPSLHAFLQRYKLVLAVNAVVLCLLLAFWGAGNSGGGGHRGPVVGRHNYYSRGGRAPSHYLSSKKGKGAGAGSGSGGKLRRTGAGGPKGSAPGQEPTPEVLGTKGRPHHPPRFVPGTLPSDDDGKAGAEGAEGAAEKKEKGESKGRARRKDFFDAIGGKGKAPQSQQPEEPEQQEPAATATAAEEPVSEVVAAPVAEGQCSKPPAAAAAVDGGCTEAHRQGAAASAVKVVEEDEEAAAAEAFPFPTASGGWPVPKAGAAPAVVLETVEARPADQEQAETEAVSHATIHQVGATVAPTRVTTRAGEPIAVISAPCAEGACPASLAPAAVATEEVQEEVAQGPTYVPSVAAAAAAVDVAPAAPAAPVAAVESSEAAPAMCSSAAAEVVPEPAAASASPESTAEEAAAPVTAELEPEPEEKVAATEPVAPAAKCGKGLDSYVAAMLGR